MSEPKTLREGSYHVPSRSQEERARWISQRDKAVDLVEDGSVWIDKKMDFSFGKKKVLFSQYAGGEFGVVVDPWELITEGYMTSDDIGKLIKEIKKTKRS